MKKTKKLFEPAIIFFTGLLMLSICLSSCKKFLDEKPDQKLAEPKTIEDVQAILDGYADMNTQSPNIGSRSDDDFYLTETYFNSLELNDRNAYTWQKNINIDDGWKTMYKVVLNANLSLETLAGINPDTYNRNAYKQAYGSALFFRGFALYQLIQVYSLPYDSANASVLPGIPVRMNSDVNTVNLRNSMQNAYQQILNDFKSSIALLPATVEPVTRPSKAAAYAMLSNVSMAMRQYHQAGRYADSALQIKNVLMDYNSINPSSTVPFTRFNSEVIFASCQIGRTTLYTRNARVDSLLYNSYESGDLRKSLFFTQVASNQFGFKGSYQASLFGIFFNGPAVDEMLLNRAECFARESDVPAAMGSLNTLLAKRFTPSAFIPVTSGNPSEALRIILAERRKELIGRGTRWNDLRRLNRENGFEKILTRKIGSETFQLLPNDIRYAFFIPQDVIAMTGMEQNER